MTKLNETDINQVNGGLEQENNTNSESKSSQETDGQKSVPKFDFHDVKIYEGKHFHVI